MKKAQVLSAIALAFALGVVAPVVGIAENASALTQVEEDDVTAINNAVNAVKNGFQLITVYNAAGDPITKVGAVAYAEYGSANTAINNMKNFVKDAKDAKYTDAGSAAETLLDAVNKAIKVDTHTVTISGTTTTKPAHDILDGAYDNIQTNTSKWNDADWAQAKSTVSEVMGIIDTAMARELNTNTANYKILELTKAEVQKIIDDEQKTLNAAILTAATNTGNKQDDLANEYKKYTNGTITFTNANAESNINAAIAAIEGKLPDIALYRNTLEAIRLLEAAKADITNTTHEHVIELIRALEAAKNGTATTNPGVTNTPANNGTNNANNNTNAAANTATDAPNTGALSTAEGTATTVSIVAGLATALTALGAGVVAYRNARRSE